MKNSFAHVHLDSAKILSKDAKELENQYESDSLGDRFESDSAARVAHDGYVSNSIISSMAFLESVINEFYDKLMVSVNSWEEEAREFAPSEEIVYQIFSGLRDIEPREFQTKPTLRKYQLMLMYHGRERFAKGNNPFQGAATVRAIRNKLVHFDPDWYDSEEPLQTPVNLPMDLKKNPFWEVDNREPESYLSHETADWCLEACGDLVIEFYNRMGFANAQLVSQIKKTIEEQ